MMTLRKEMNAMYVSGRLYWIISRGKILEKCKRMIHFYFGGSEKIRLSKIFQIILQIKEKIQYYTLNKH